METLPEVVDYTARYLSYYGAALASLTVLWQLYTHWARGPNLSVQSMHAFITSSSGLVEEPRYLTIVVRNRGNETTTVSSVTIVGFGRYTLFPRLWKRMPKKLKILMPIKSLGDSLPCEIKVGSQVSFCTLKSDELISWSKNHDLYAKVSHSFSSKLVWCRISDLT
jgi:hypothetical protein